MKKKKLVLLSSAAVLSLALVGSIGTIVCASAATIDQDNEASDQTTMKVTYTVEDAWSVTIPDSIVVGGESVDISASGVKIEEGKSLTVTVSSANEWKVKDAEEHAFDYELKGQDGSGEALTNGNTVLTVTAGTASGSDKLKATVEAGRENYSTGGEEYSDTLTFTVEVK